MTYATAADLAQWMDVNESGLDPTAPMGLVVEAASRAIDKYCGRTFEPRTEPQTRWYTPGWFKDRWTVDTGDITTTEDLVIETDSGTPITDFVLTPRNGSLWTGVEILPRSAVKPSGARDSVKVTARWGFEEPPHAVKLACLMQSARWYDRRSNPSGPLSEQTVDDLTTRWTGVASDLDSDVKAMLAPLRKLWFCA